MKKYLRKKELNYIFKIFEIFHKLIYDK